MLKKGVYPYEYMDDWKSLMKRHYIKKIYSNLNMEEITDADYMHGKRVCQDFLKENI